MSAVGEFYGDLNYVITKPINGFLIGITDENGTTNPILNQRLCFAIWTTNRVLSESHLERIAFPISPEYAYQVSLFDTNGLEVAKTETGKQIGIHFPDFSLTSFKSGISLERADVEGTERPTELHIFCRPGDLFKVDHPGHYILRIRMQILAFPWTGTNSDDHRSELIRFPPIEFPEVQPEKGSPI